MDGHDERRKSSIESILIELGSIKQMTSDTKDTVTKLDVKVGIQNGRIGKIEIQQSFWKGAIALFILLNLPIFLYVVKEIISKIRFVG